MTVSRKRTLLLATCLYLLSVIFSVYCLELKRSALQFHTRDYNYFIEQAARLVDPQLEDRFALNIEGFNFIGLQGIEGAKNLYQAIHAEYFRYFYAMLYGIFRSTLPIFIFYCIVFFFPLPYFALIANKKTLYEWQPVVLFALLYTLFPANLNSITSDLRPRMLFASAWCLAVLTIYFDRPFFEKLVFLGLLIGIREEGTLLGMIVIALNFLRMRGKPGRWKQTLIFLFLDIAALILFLVFMSWGGYNRIDNQFDPRLLISTLLSTYLPLLLGIASLVLLLCALVWYKKREYFSDCLSLIVYAVGMVLAGVQILRDLTTVDNVTAAWFSRSGWDIYLEFVTPASGALVFYLGILILALLWYYSAGIFRISLTALLTLLCALFVVTNLIVIPSQLKEWQQKVPAARLVWSFVQNHDRYQTDVMVDYDTYQAFYNFDKVIVYNRLPVWDTLPEKRFYPQNKEALVKQIQQHVEYAVIARSSLENVVELVRLAGFPVVELASNESYVVLKLR